MTPTHITFDGHTWIKNTAVKLTPIVTSPLFLLYWYLSRRSQFQLEFTLSGISGYMYGTCTVHTVKIVKSTLANGWFPIFIVCKFFPLVYSEFVMK